MCHIYNAIHIRFGGYVYDISYTYYTVLSADFLDFRSSSSSSSSSRAPYAYPIYEIH